MAQCVKWGFFTNQVHSPRTGRFHHVDRIAGFVPLARVVGWEFDCWLRYAIFVQNEGKLIVSIAAAFEAERPLRCIAGDLRSDLRRALPLTCLDANFLRVENRRASLVSEFYCNVVVEVII